MCLCWLSTTKINYGKWLTQFPFQEYDLKIEEDLDDFFLSNLCKDIIEEASDLGSEHMVLAHSILKSRAERKSSTRDKYNTY
jgi:hypothetical protein